VNMMNFMIMWPTMLVVIGAIVASQYYESNRWSIVFAFISAFQLISYYAVPWTMVCAGIAIYLPTGTVFSFWRYKRYVCAVVKRTRYTCDEFQKTQAMKRLHPTRMWTTIVTWIIVWPFSMMSSIVSDIVSVAEIVITRILRGAYHRIYDRAVKEIDASDDNNTPKVE